MIREWVGGPAPGLVHIFRQDFCILHTTYYTQRTTCGRQPCPALCMYIIPLQTVCWRFICMFPLFIRAAPPAAAAGYPAKLAIILVLVSQFGYIKLHLLGSIGMYRIGIPNNKLFLRCLTIGIGGTVFCLCFSHKRPWLFC